jgi:hypothetical protein
VAQETVACCAINWRTAADACRVKQMSLSRLPYAVCTLPYAAEADVTVRRPRGKREAGKL